MSGLRLVSMMCSDDLQLFLQVDTELPLIHCSQEACLGFWLGRELFSNSYKQDSAPWWLQALATLSLAVLMDRPQHLVVVPATAAISKRFRTAPEYLFLGTRDMLGYQPCPSKRFDGLG